MARHQRRRAAVRVPVASHVIELVPVSTRPGARVLYVDGVAQSYVDLVDPTYLHFDYVRRMASVIDAAAPKREPVDALHLGGGGFTLPRYLAATRPDSTQVVVERDAALLDLVQRELPLPHGDLRVRLADAGEAIEAEPAAGYDLVLADVYEAAKMPAHVAGVEFAAQVARVLRPDGLYTVNLTDLPPLGYSRVQAATLRAVFADVCLIAGRAMLRGRRYGNVVLAAARKPGRLPVARLTTRALRDPVAGVVLHGAALDRFIDGAQPLHQTTSPSG
ncbi:fused MFS/spermidine synthase [Phytohabitans sp. ZYX-F-186]|uniref:Fused MFS/spermidine synthase n=1 Tax=Phytohabitans maris TaxID=3071409 RepID=A0ABU0ZD75_9ACTN|nr:fused MFS/spermidine synthase [Phytohabitans sp. ZYX-F-186]MDQ7905013.1 fused MFS/spermidine synthase [Phytohabitans sp. ZYX-F-186]